MDGSCSGDKAEVPGEGFIRSVMNTEGVSQESCCGMM